MAIKKRQRKYSQDFSGKSLTDQSFAPACDVNNIVRHYESTGLDPFEGRKNLERFEEASTLTYEDAMRNKAEMDSRFADLTPQELDALRTPPPAEPEAEPTEPDGLAEPAAEPLPEVGTG